MKEKVLYYVYKTQDSFPVMNNYIYSTVCYVTEWKQ